MVFSFWQKSGAEERTRWLVTAFMFLLGWGLAGTDLGQKLEWKTEDERLEWRARSGGAPHEALLLIGIDEESLEMLGQWPFERAMHGFLMDWMGRAEETRPAAMAWDLLFVDLGLEPASDDAMTAPLAGLPYPVVMGAALSGVADDGKGRGLMSGGKAGVARKGLARVSEQAGLAGLRDGREALLPIPQLLETTSIGFLDAGADSDGIVRRVPMLIRVGDEVYPSLVLETLLAYWKTGPEAVEIVPGEAVKVRKADGAVASIPIDAEGQYRLNYRHEVKTVGNARGMPTMGYFSVYSALALREQAGDKTTPAPATGGRIVVVGQTAVGLADIGPSPIRGQSSKALVHLNALDNVLREDFLTVIPVWCGLAAVLLAGLGLGNVMGKRRYWVLGVAALGLGAGVVVAAQVALGWGSVMVPLAAPLLALGLQQGAFATLKVREEQAKRVRIRGMFATYVASALVDRMVESGEEPRLGGEEAEITAYFSDIESFSSFSEVLGPKQLVELMNEYLSACTELVQEEGGTLDKYIGDAVVAFYGAPLPVPNHGHRAVTAALRVHRRCDELRAKWRAEQATKGWPDIVTNLQTRIGLNLGMAVVGNMGSHTRFNYTMMGDTVNLAARMESGAKAYGVYTMVTESVVAASRVAAPDAVLFRPLDRIVVKGRSQPVAIHEAMALKEDATPAMRECAGLFADGLARYFARDWAGARERFEGSLRLEVHAKNNPSRVLLKRVAVMEAQPPGPEWDGVFTMTSK